MDVLSGGHPRRRNRTRALFINGTATLAAFALLCGCQVNYILKSAASQAELLMKRVPVAEAIDDETISPEIKRKLKLAQEARRFGETDLGLKATKNYTSFVQLDRPYVTYVVSAAPREKLIHHLWKYPLLGELPYRGYFNEPDALAEADSLKRKGLDTYVRGVSAYSTLGWFRDPILSSMLSYKDHELVNTIIHETVHATLYIRSEADFNERLATFIGNKGTEMFYLRTEGERSPTLERIRRENHDDKLFSEFISAELTALEAWYAERSGREIAETERTARLAEVRARYISEVKPALLEGGYRSLEAGEINNASLLNYRLYFEDLSAFETAFRRLGGDFRRFLEFCKSLEAEKEPWKTLAEGS